jgi:hypothetical protein
MFSHKIKTYKRLLIKSLQSYKHFFEYTRVLKKNIFGDKIGEKLTPTTQKNNE